MLQPRKRFTQKKRACSLLFIHISFILSASGNHWLPLVARWSSSPTAPTSSWLPALPTRQAASIGIAGNDGSRCRKGRFVGKVLDFVGNLLAIVELFDQTRSTKGFTILQGQTRRKTGKLQANITGITPSHIISIRVQVRDPQNISKLQPNLSCLPLTPARSGSGLQGSWVTASKGVP